MAEPGALQAATRQVCPCCGGLGEVSVVEPLTMFEGRRLTRSQGLILRWLLDQPERLVRHDSLITLLWGDDEGLAAKNNLKVRICQLRRVLNGSGWSIETVWGLGYRLRPPGRPCPEGALQAAE